MNREREEGTNKRLVELDSDLDGAVDEARDLHEVALDEAARGHEGRSEANSAGNEGLGVARDRVLVAVDAGLLHDGVDARAVDALVAEVDEDEVVVGAAADEDVAELDELLAHRLGVLLRLDLVLLELRRHGLLEGDGDAGDGVVVGATLEGGEDGRVDAVLQIVEDLFALHDLLHTAAEEDEASTRATEGLVGRRGDNVAVVEGATDK